MNNTPETIIAPSPNASPDSPFITSQSKNVPIKCVVCGKEDILVDKFPYNKGWRYIYKFQWKKSENERLEIFDKRFCSNQCLTLYVYEMTKQGTTRPVFYKSESSMGQWDKRDKTLKTKRPSSNQRDHADQTGKLKKNEKRKTKTKTTKKKR